MWGGSFAVLSSGNSAEAAVMMPSSAQLRYRLVDIGANLNHPSFRSDLDQVLKRAEQAGLCKVMVTGTSVKLSKEARDLAGQFPNFLFFTAGVHPHDAKEFDDNTMQELKELCGEPTCVAVGECGLDFNRNFSPRDQQRLVFDKQLRLACDLKKPLFIHERDAHEDMIAALTRYKERLPPVVIHCFTGKAADAEAYIEMGCFIGLTGYLWKDRSDDGIKYALRNNKIPLDRLVLETDAPFMYTKIDDKRIPAEIRNRITDEARSFHRFASFNRNEPCALAAICELIAAYMNEDPVKVADVTTANAKHIYGLNLKNVEHI
uniref:Deoxyribonuclease TATDN1 n=1 Tax=Setaria digitata TaxID=48799 RepID=A0A915PPZ1_9BILA